MVCTRCYLNPRNAYSKKHQNTTSQPSTIMSLIPTITKRTDIPTKVEYAGTSAHSNIVSANFVANGGSQGPVTINIPQGYDYFQVIANVNYESTSALPVKLVSDEGSSFFLYATPAVKEYILPAGFMKKLTATFSPVPSGSNLILIFNFFNKPPVGIGQSNVVSLDNAQVPLPVTVDIPSVGINPKSLPLWVTDVPPIGTPESGRYKIIEECQKKEYQSYLNKYSDGYCCGSNKVDNDVRRARIQRDAKLESYDAQEKFKSGKYTRAYPESALPTAAKDEKPNEGITAGASTTEASNVVLAETQAESRDVCSLPVTPEWYQLSTTEQCKAYEDLTDRWLYWKSFEWKEGQVENTLLTHDILPLSWLNSSRRIYCNTPNFIPFNVHSYWRGDMEVKIYVNSSCFQSGMLLMSWLYAADSYEQDSLLDTRYGNVALAVQRAHVKVSAGASNEATLSIPFRYVRPFVRSKNIYPNTVANSLPLNLGRLTITPLVALATGSNDKAPKSCDCSLYIKLIKSKFTGMIDGSLANTGIQPPPPKNFMIAYPEMAFAQVSKVVGKVAGMVDNIIGDVNADDPPMTEPGKFFVPMNAQSWSHGTKAKEPTYTLRLDGRRIGVGRSADIGYSETQIQRVVSVYGLLRPIVWSNTDAAKNQAGALLWNMGVHPQCDKDKVYMNNKAGMMDIYTLPPLGVVSSCFCYWRGSINFKFDIVATGIHTGRILVAYIPGIPDSSKVTLAQAKSSAHVVFSLNRDTTSFTFTVPYIADTMWWPRKYGGPQKASDFIAPSSIVMFVVTKLVPMESIAQYVTILPFVCAGPDFEVSVPAQPSIGLGTNRINVIPDANTISFKSGYYPVYVGEWRNWLDGKKQILRYGATTDHVAQLTTPLTPPAGKIYYYRPRNITSFKMYQTSIQGGVFQAQGNRGVKPVPRSNYRLGYGVVYSQDGYNYMIPFPITNDINNPGEVAAQVLAIALYQKKDPRIVANAIPDWSVDSDYLTQNNIVWEPIELDPNSSFRVELVAKPESATYSTVSRNETPNVMLPTSLLPSTKSGVVTYGESFHDIKDLCRRYQLYWEGTVSPGIVRANKRNAAFVQIPVLAQGLALEPSLENAVWNNMRDGHIPVLSSGFRFYRGGVRFRIVITGLQDSVWVQHHPDRELNKPSPILGKNINDKDAYRNHSYAFHVQNLSVNRTLEIEVPYYRPGLYNLLGKANTDTDSREYTSIGDIVIGLEGDQPVSDPIDIAVYYSLADDCSFNVFTGFPAMVYCDEVFKEGVGIQSADEAPIYDNVAGMTLKEEPPDIDEDGYVIAKPEMLSTFATSAISSVFGSVAGNVAVKGIDALSAPVARVVKKEVNANIKPLIRDIEKTVTEAASDISSTIGRTLPQQAIIGALGQFSQVALNPTPAAIAVAITTMVSNFVVISLELILTMQELLTKFLQEVWRKYFAPPSDLQGGGVVAEPEGFFDEMNDKTLHGFLGLLFTSVASTVGVSVAKPGSFPNVMKGVKECLNVCNSSVVFFRNVIDSVVYMYKYCLGETSEELKAKIIIEREYPHMKDWCEEVMSLLDPRNSNVILHSSRQANRVFDACIYGSKLIQENLDTNVPGGKVIYDLYTKICKLRDDLIELGNHPDIRFEAFPIWISGPAGVGKSYMTQEVCKEMLRAIDYRTNECMIYWLALGQKYWNGVKNPPVIARDEAYAVGGQFTEEEIATHLAICSSSILNPPMAALQEKNKRLNPLIYYMNSNLEFPQINEARHPEAIYRRRKILARVSYTPEILERYPGLLDASEIQPADKVNFSHLQFEIARDPKDRTTQWAGPYKYADFIQIVKNRFVEHVTQERINFRHRMSSAYSLDPDYDPRDELNYVRGPTLTPETLHERYLRERQMAREILYTPPPTVEDDEYISSVLQRFSYLWRPTEHAQPEMNYDMPSTSGSSPGFYTDAQRMQAEHITNITNLSRGAVMKLLSGDAMYTDEDINSYVIDDHFSALVQSRRLKMAFSVLVEPSYCLPNWINEAWRSCGWDDTLSPSQGNTFMTTYIPHWEELTGVDAIRSYAYWVMRQQQYKLLIQKLLSMSEAGELREKLFGLMADMLPVSFHRDLRNLHTVAAVEKFFSSLDSCSVAQVDAIAVIYCLTRLLNHVVDINQQEFCSHCRFWCTHLHNTSQLEFNARYQTILYRNSLGLLVRFDDNCKCLHSFTRNMLYMNSMRIIWNHDHGLTGHTVHNPFSFASHCNTEEQVSSWLRAIFEFAKDWWRAVAVPYASLVLTFLYEHFGKIVALLLGIYALYSAFTYYNGSATATKVVETATTAAAKTAEVIGNVAAGVVVSRVMSDAPTPQPKPAPPPIAPTSAPPSTPPVPPVAAAVESSNYSKIEKPKAAKSGGLPAQREGFESQMTAFEQSVTNNICYLVASFDAKNPEKPGERNESWMQCLGLRARQLLVLKHYIEDMIGKEDMCIMLKCMVNGKCATSFIPVECFFNARYFTCGGDDSKCNFALIELPKYVPMFKNIMTRIVRRAGHESVANTASQIAKTQEGKLITRYNIPIGYQKYLLVQGSEQVKDIRNDIVYAYKFHGNGMCGTLLVGEYVCDGNPGIIGIHIAGVNGLGFAEPIYREMFDGEIIQPQVDYRLPNLESVDKADVELDSNLLLYGTVKPEYAHRESGKTKIVPSLLHGHVFPVLTEPNPLLPNDPRQPPGSHPLRDGCNKHGFGHSKPFPQHLIDQVQHDQRQILMNKVKKPLVQLRCLTLQEAVCGSTSIPHCEAINWKSSEGFPLSSLRPKGANNKKYLFDLEETNDGYKLKGIDPKLEALLIERQRFRNKKAVFPPIYIDCLKDYRLPPHKCAMKGKTRIFSIAPIQVTIDIRRYMGLFLSAYRSAFIYGQHGIGINADSLDWTNLANYLHEVGDNIVTGDYVNFGPSLSSQLVVESISDIIYWHKMNGAPEELIENLTLILENEITNPLHLCSNLVYQSINGIASGSPITAELNSEVNKYYIKLAFLLLAENLGLKLGMRDFNAKVRLVTYGDDFIMSVHDDYIGWFNLATIADVLHPYGIVLTDVVKGIEKTPYRRLLQSSFLKRSWKLHPKRRNCYLAPIEEASITECVNWCHKQTDMMAATQEVIRASCVLAFGHGPHYYRRHTEAIHKVASVLGIEVEYPSWDELDKDNFG